MQMFLPYHRFDLSAAVLDNARLGNQCYREALTLIRGGWQHHPASKMWRGYERALAQYGLACAVEMSRRDHWRSEVITRWLTHWAFLFKQLPDTGMPPWIGDDEFHLMHRRVLLAKAPEHYRQYWPELEPAVKVDGQWPYLWPKGE
ncbi:cytoplasmic protein [Candidatus Uhrbacteria bacterium]|nr:cytoplasmic protein [Candidatus Uhrbacteria bacterium]